MTVFRNGHLRQLTPAEAKQRAAHALAAIRAVVRRGHSTSAESGPSGKSGKRGIATGIPVPAPAAAWAVGCYAHGAPGHPPLAGNSGKSGNSGTSGNG
jgi:hypothetical protein